MIEDLFVHDCSIVKVERDSYGDYLPANPIPTECRATDGYKVVKNNAGEEVVSSIKFLLPPTVDINGENLIKRLIKYNDKDYSIISINDRQNLSGETQWKVVFV